MKGMKVIFIGAFFMLATAMVGAKQPAADNPLNNAGNNPVAPQFGGPRYDQAAVERGQQLFVAQCGFCHGSNAAGGQSGPDLIRSVMVMNDEDGATNWPAPSFNPDTGLFYVGTSQSYSIYYLTDTDPRPQGWGAAERGAGGLGNYLRAIDYKTGKVVWKHSTLNGAQGLLSTAGGLLFGGDGAGNFVAYDPLNGKPLWHASLTANPSNAPQTYTLDGRQYVVVGAGDSLFAFMLQK